MAEETQQPREYREFDPSVISISGGGGDFPDYVKLEEDEPYEAFVQALKIGKKFNKTAGAEEDRVYVWCEVVEGEGKGQRYRADFSPKLTLPGAPRKSNLTEFLDKLYGEEFEGKINAADVIGRPIRIELSAPWGDKNLQFINTFKKPLSSQKRVDVATQVADPVPTELVDVAELDFVFSGK